MRRRLVRFTCALLLASLAVAWAAAVVNQLSHTVSPVLSPEELRGLEIREESDGGIPNWGESVPGCPEPVLAHEAVSGRVLAACDPFESRPHVRLCSLPVAPSTAPLQCLQFEDTRYVHEAGDGFVLVFGARGREEIVLVGPGPEVRARRAVSFRPRPCFYGSAVSPDGQGGVVLASYARGRLGVTHLGPELEDLGYHEYAAPRNVLCELSAKPIRWPGTVRIAFIGAGGYPDFDDILYFDARRRGPWTPPFWARDASLRWTLESSALLSVPVLVGVAFWRFRRQRRQRDREMDRLRRLARGQNDA